MTISEFAKMRGVEAQTVSAYLKNHKLKYNRKTGLTEKQLEILEKKYPIPKPTTIVNGLDPDEERKLREELQKAQSALTDAQNLIIRLSDEKYQLQTENASLKLLEDKSSQKIEELEGQIEKLKNRKLFDRIFNKI